MSLLGKGFLGRKKPVASDARTVDLWQSADEPRPNNRSGHPELLSPIPLPVPHNELFENKGALLQLITTKVEALHANGGLDLESIDALFHEIQSWRDGPAMRITQENEQRRKVAALLLARLSSDLEHTKHRLRALEQLHHEILEHHQAVLIENGFTGKFEIANASEWDLLSPVSHLDGHLPNRRQVSDRGAAAENTSKETTR